MAQNSPFSVTKVKTAFACPRLFYLGHKFGGRVMFNSSEKILPGFGITYHNLAEECLEVMKNNIIFNKFLECSPEEIEPEQLTRQLQELLYERVFLPYLQAIKNNQSQKLPVLQKLWQGLHNLINNWVELLILNRHYCPADKVIRKTFILQEYALRYNFKLPNQRFQTVTGRLDSLIFDFSTNRLSVVDYKTYQPCEHTAQFVQVVLYSYMLKHLKGIPVDARIYYIFPELKEDVYTWEELDETVDSLIPSKLQQMQEWLIWESGRPSPPPATSQPELCQLCPQKQKCQSFF